MTKRKDSTRIKETVNLLNLTIRKAYSSTVLEAKTRKKSDGMTVILYDRKDNSCLVSMLRQEDVVALRDFCNKKLELLKPEEATQPIKDQLRTSSI